MFRFLPHVLAAFPVVTAPVPRPVFVEDRAEIPWIVVSTPGSTCGTFKISGGPKGSRNALLAAVNQQKEQGAATATPPAPSSLALLSTPGLWGLEGEVVVAAAEALLRRSSVDGAVSLRIGAGGAWLDLPARPTTASLATWFSAQDLKAIVGIASSRLARRRSNVGALAVEEAQRFSCHGVGADPPLPSDLGRRLRTRFG